MNEYLESKYISGDLSLSDIRKYQSFLHDKDLSHYVRNSFDLDKINHYFGTIFNFLKIIPEELDFEYNNYFKNNITKLDDLSDTRLLLKDVIKFNSSYLSDNYLERLDKYSKYLPIVDFVDETERVRFISKCSLSLLREFNEKYNKVLDRDINKGNIKDSLLGILMSFSIGTRDYRDINNIDDLISHFEKIVYNIRRSRGETANFIFNKYREELAEIFPRHFINYDLSRGYADIYKVDISALTTAMNGDTKLLFNLVNKYPKLVSLYQDKELFADLFKQSKGHRELFEKDINVLEVASKYGIFLNEYFSEMPSYKTDKLIEKLKEADTDYIDNEIYSFIKTFGLFDIRYLPDSFKNKYPELYLDRDAPSLLENCYYNLPGYKMNLNIIKSLGSAKEYLKDKTIELSLLKNVIDRKGLIKFFAEFGREKALNLLKNKNETVSFMLEMGKVDLLIAWRDKIKFIPHHMVMMEFPLDKSDKFVSSSNKWSRLMNVKKDATEFDVNALINASIAFGVFDSDDKGYKDLLDIITSIPSKLSYEDINKIKQSNLDIEQILNSYKLSKDGNYTLSINPEQDKKQAALIRETLEKAHIDKVLNFYDFLVIFSDFSKEYKPEFTKFFLNNFNEIIERKEDFKNIYKVHKDWEKINNLNSGRKLTLDIALAYANATKYVGIDPGNEALADLSSKVGYSEENFIKLQEIYNYGKRRVYSSIPRIVKDLGEYNYEVLKLDDPLALAIGTLTDCCQEIGALGDSCMVHSATDQDGRVFVVRDKEGRIIAQSWMWRNGDTVCFDNIEIPHKIRRLSDKPAIKIAEEVYRVYKDAAEELIEEERILNDNPILSKVTVGTGYNDIKKALEIHGIKDLGNVKRPKEFKSPIRRYKKLHIKDSEKQYILAGHNTKVGDTPNPVIYKDEYKVLHDGNTSELDMLSLQKLELISKGSRYLSKTYPDNKNHLVSSIGSNYYLRPEKTRIIKHPNFAVIYEDGVDRVILGDILYNPNIKVSDEEINIGDKIDIHLRHALDQISENKEIDSISLGEKENEILTRVMNLEKNNKVYSIRKEMG